MTTAPSKAAETTGSGDQPPGRRKGLALAVLAGAQLMIVLDATIVNIALPHIRTALDFSPTSLSWVMNAYTLTFGGLLLLGGRLGDVLGRRRMFTAGLLIFTIASLLGGFAQNEAMLLVARALQGVGGALAAPAVLSLLTTTFDEGPERNKALGVYAAVSGGGSAVGLLAGGLLVEYLSWRWVMFVNVPIGAALIVAIPVVLAADPPRGKAAGVPGERATFDIPGALTSTLGVTALVYGVIRAAEENDWADGLVVTSLVASVVLLAAFVVIEMRTERPLMPLRLFANRNRSGSYVVMMLAGAGMMAAFFFITMFMQEVLDYSALQAGTAYLPLCAGVIVAAQFASRFLPVAGPRVLLTAGSGLAGASLLYLSFLEPDSGYVTHLLPSMIGMGVGMGTVFVSIMATAVSGIAPQDSGIGSAMINVTQQIGGTIGFSALITVSTTVAVDKFGELTAKAVPGAEPEQVNMIMAEAQTRAQTEGWTTALLVAAGLLAVSALTALTVLRVDRSRIAQQAPAAVH